TQSSSSFFCTATTPSRLSTLSLHDALPICAHYRGDGAPGHHQPGQRRRQARDPGPRLQRCLIPGALLFLKPRRPCHTKKAARTRSEEHTSELQSRENLVCRLLLEKKKKKTK